MRPYMPDPQECAILILLLVEAKTGLAVKAVISNRPEAPGLEWAKSQGLIDSNPVETVETCTSSIVPVGLCGQVTEMSRVSPDRTSLATRSTSRRQPSSNERSTTSRSAAIARGVSRLVA